MSPGNPDLPAGRPVRVFLVDDHEVVRRGLIGLLSSDPELVIVGAAGSVREAIPKHLLNEELRLGFQPIRAEVPFRDIEDLARDCQPKLIGQEADVGEVSIRSCGPDLQQTRGRGRLT